MPPLLITEPQEPFKSIKVNSRKQISDLKFRSVFKNGQNEQKIGLAMKVYVGKNELDNIVN